jgi:ribonuclease HII
VKTGRPEIDEAVVDYVIGSDEAGHGTWAGDLVVVAVAVSPRWVDPEVKDSKDLSARVMLGIARRYHTDRSISKIIHRTSPTVIDRCGLWRSLICAHNHVHEALAATVRAVHNPTASILHIVDGLENARDRLHPYMHPLAKADQLIPAVSLASCFAKVVQCALMDRAAAQYPGYHFERSRGYGTPQHRKALASLGPCPIHRMSFGPLSKFK